MLIKRFPEFYKSVLGSVKSSVSESFHMRTSSALFHYRPTLAFVVIPSVSYAQVVK